MENVEKEETIRDENGFFKKRRNKIILISLLVLILVPSIVGICIKVYNDNKIDETELVKFENAIKQNDNIKKYLNQVTIKGVEGNRYDDFTFYDYTVWGKMNNDFNKLSKDQKYYILLDFIHVLEEQRDNFGGGSFECGKGKICDFDKVELRFKDTFYSMEFEKGKPDYSFAMVVNDGEEYRPSEQQKALDNSIEDVLTDTTDSHTYSNITLTEDDKINAWGYAQKVVKDNLKSPSTAKFPWFDESFVTVSNGNIIISAYVDAENDFGAKLRSNFNVTLDSDYNIIDVSIE